MLVSDVINNDRVLVEALMLQFFPKFIPSAFVLTVALEL